MQLLIWLKHSLHRRQSRTDLVIFMDNVIIHELTILIQLKYQDAFAININMDLSACWQSFMACGSHA